MNNIINSIDQVLSDLASDYPELGRVRVQLDYPRWDSPACYRDQVRPVLSVSMSEEGARPVCVRYEHDGEAWLELGKVCYDCGEISPTIQRDVCMACGMSEEDLCAMDLNGWPSATPCYAGSDHPASPAGASSLLGDLLEHCINDAEDGGTCARLMLDEWEKQSLDADECGSAAGAIAALKRALPAASLAIPHPLAALLVRVVDEAGLGLDSSIAPGPLLELTREEGDDRGEAWKDDRLLAQLHAEGIHKLGQLFETLLAQLPIPRGRLGAWVDTESMPQPMRDIQDEERREHLLALDEHKCFARIEDMTCDD